MNRVKLVMFFTFILCLLLLLFSACNNQQKETASSEWSNRDTWISSGAASEQGYYYFRDVHYLCFYDFASQKSVYLCEKAGCPHRDGDCHSYMLYATPSFVFYHGEKLYFLERQTEGLKLTRRDNDGGNYEEVLFLMQNRQEKDTTLEIADYRVCGSRLYYIGSAVKDSRDDGMEHASLLYQVNLDTGKEELLLDLGEKGAGFVAAREGQVLLQQNQETPKTPEEFATGEYKSKDYLSSVKHLVMLWDEKTGEMSTLLEDNRWNLMGGIAAYEDSYYIIRWDENHEVNFVERRSLDGSQTETVFSPSCQISNFSIPGNTEFSFLLSNETKWRNFELPDFAENPVSFMDKFDRILYASRDGYFIERVLDYEGDWETGATITKAAYSYLSFEDAKAGKKNYVDFYIRDYSEF